MDLGALRKFCLSFPHASENLQWEDALCFKVGRKIFALLGLDSLPQRLSFKCTPERFAELCELENIRPAPYVGRYHWVVLDGLDLLPDDVLRDLIRQSYQMVRSKAKSKTMGSKRDPAAKQRKQLYP